MAPEILFASVSVSCDRNGIVLIDLEGRVILTHKTGSFVARADDGMAETAEHCNRPP